jgi:hypothetical protein
MTDSRDKLLMVAMLAVGLLSGMGFAFGLNAYLNRPAQAAPAATPLPPAALVIGHDVDDDHPVADGCSPASRRHAWGHPSRALIRSGRLAS